MKPEKDIEPLRALNLGSVGGPSFRPPAAMEASSSDTSMMTSNPSDCRTDLESSEASHLEEDDVAAGVGVGMGVRRQTGSRTAKQLPVPGPSERTSMDPPLRFTNSLATAIKAHEEYW